MKLRSIDDEARAAFARAVKAVEGASAVEVVVAVRQRSSAYLHANVIVGAAAAFGGLAAMLFAAHAFSLTAILFDPFIAGLVAGGLVELVPQLKRVATPANWLDRHVRRAARATFVERGVHHTTGRSGLLVYLSWLEQQVVLVADGGLAHALPEGALDTAERALTVAFRRGGAAVAAALEALGPQLGDAMPHQADDVNELPDAIDEGGAA